MSWNLFVQQNVRCCHFRWDTNEAITKPRIWSEFKPRWVAIPSQGNKLIRNINNMLALTNMDLLYFACLFENEICLSFFSQERLYGAVQFFCYVSFRSTTGSVCLCFFKSLSWKWRHKYMSYQIFPFFSFSHRWKENTLVALGGYRISRFSSDTVVPRLSQGLRSRKNLQ